MRIKRYSLFEGLNNARGTIVVIDVFRAFTCEPLMFYYGARRIYLESDIEKCKSHHGDAILVGEYNELPIESFDLTNSPFLIMAKGREFFHERDVIHRTTSGVTGAVAAIENSDDVLLSSFVTAMSTARYIQQNKPELVSIVSMGIRSIEKAPEDEYCGDYIESLLTGKRYDHIQAVKEILNHETARKFLRGDKSYLPKEDPLICLQRDLFTYTLKAHRDGNNIVALRVYPDI